MGNIEMEDWDAPLSLRQGGLGESIPDLEENEIELADDIEVDGAEDLLRVELPDGSVSISLGGYMKPPGAESKEHQANLAEHLDQSDLDSIAVDLLQKIEEDDSDQKQRLDDIAKGLEILGVKLEEPNLDASSGTLSVVRHPLLLEAVLRFQANARGEILPADGPIKVRDDGPGTTEDALLANKLAKDMNHYLTSTAKEYYPDTDRMLFSLGFGGEAYKKVYYDPIKRRPVSMTVDRKDIILSKGAVSLEQCARVTHRYECSPSVMKRMILAGAWIDIETLGNHFAEPTVVDKKLSDIAGVDPNKTDRPEEADRVIYECYCELDLPGFEHKEKGKKTGLQLPYRVTIDKDAQKVLEIRRWWSEDDEMAQRKEVFVEYVFVPAFPGLNLGLLHILGNSSRALTAAWRIALDAGMLGNFPGGLVARESGRQQTTNIRVAPGELAPVDTNGQSLRDVVMPLPYKEVGPGFLGLIEEITNTAQRVGGTAELEIGEGRQDTPVGTTIALIDQATKVMAAVHKRIHAAQCKEFALLKELFREEPEILIRGNKHPELEDAQIIDALDNADLIPAADPNTASQMMRIQKAIAVKTLQGMNPGIYDAMAVDRRVLQMIDVPDAEELFAKEPPPPMSADPANMVKAQAAMITAQAKAQDVAIKAQTSEKDMAVKVLQARTEAEDSHFDNMNRAADRESKIEIERMKLAQEQIRLQHDMRLEGARMQHDVAMREKDDQREDIRTQQDLVLGHQKHQQDMQMKSEQHKMGIEQKKEQHKIAVSQQKQSHSMGLKQKEEAHATGLKLKEQQAKQAAKQKPKSDKK
jgi:hypothetical protein